MSDTVDVLEPFFGTMRGYRTWRIVKGDPPKLRSLFHHTDEAWKGPVGTAYCLSTTHWEFSYRPKSTHQPPAPQGSNCQCGLFAYFDYRPLRNNHLDRADFGLPVIAGAVEAYGATECCEIGFRTAKAVIVALSPPRMCTLNMSWPHRGTVDDFASPEELHEARQVVAAALGVPFYDEFGDMAADFPPTHQDEIVQDSLLWIQANR